MGFFFDTNALVCVFDRADSAKQSTAQAPVTIHMSARDRVISTQVLQALYVTLTRKKRLNAADALEVVTTFAQQRTVPAGADWVLRGLALSQQAQRLAWGALVVQSAPDAGCTTLCSEAFSRRHAVWRVDRAQPVCAGGAGGKRCSSVARLNASWTLLWQWQRLTA